jgi:hypothetical protein
MVGLLITIVLDSRGGWIYQTIWVKREMGFTVDWGSSARIYLTAFLAFAVAYLVINVLNLRGWVELISGGIAYLFVYVAGLPLSGALNRVDFMQLEATVDALGPIAPIAKTILSMMSRLTRATIK